MKRVISILLSLTMIFSFITAVSVTAADEGRDGEVVVYLRDFENGAKLASDVGNITDVKEDFRGNHFANVMTSASAIMNAPTGAETRIGSVYENRASIKFNIPYISGKNYNISWKLGKVEADKVSPIGRSTSGIETMSGGALLTYKNVEGVWTKNSITQWYDVNLANDAKGTSKPTQTAVKEEAGWQSFKYSNIAYALCKSTKDSTLLGVGKSANITSLFFSMSGVGDGFKQLLLENQAYCGKGLTDFNKVALTDTFTLDADHVYGDEACIADGTYTKETLVGTTWTLGKDCRGLKSAKREAAFAAALAANNKFSYALDDVKVTAKAKLYDNTVTAPANATIKVITTAGLGDADNTPTVVAPGETKIVEVNDYYGVTFEIVPEEGYYVKSAKYGEDAVYVDNGQIVVSSDKVASGKALTLKLSKAPLYKERSVKYSLKGGTTGTSYTDPKGSKSGKYIQSPDGNLAVAVGGTADTVDVLNAEEGYFEWNSGSASQSSKKRMYVYLPNTKVGSGRKVQLKFDFSNGGTANYGVGYTQMTPTRVRYYENNKVYANTGYQYGKVAAGSFMLHINGFGGGVSNGTVKAGGTQTAVSPLYNVIKFSNDRNMATTSYNDKTYQEFIWFEFVANSYSANAKPRLHAVEFIEKVPCYGIKATQNDANGSVKLSSDSLNFGVDNADVEIGAGESAYVEHGMTANFAITAPSGKVIDTVIYKDFEENETDLSASAVDQKSASVSVAVIDDYGTLSVTYKNEPVSDPSVSGSDFSAVTSDFSYIPEGSDTPVVVSGKKSIITYGRITVGSATVKECGFYLTELNADETAASKPIKLPATAVPAGLTYGIRMFGAAIDAGKYSLQPYIITDDDTEIKGTANIVTVA